MIKILGILLLIFLGSALLTGTMLRYAINKKLLDIPNKRSMHKISKPSGGGAGFVLLYSITLFVLMVSNIVDAKFISCLLVGGLLISGIGFLDDHKPLPVRTRIIIHIAAAIFAIYMIGGIIEIQLNNRIIQLGWFGDLFAVFFIVWLVNLYNFMDGIDGIASIEAISVTIGSAIIILLSHTDGSNYQLLQSEINIIIFVSLSLAFAICGFLIWNWPPSKIFMGDVGSGYLGYILSVIAIYTHNVGLINIWAWLILLGVFLVDTSVTLVMRILTGQEWPEAHRTHAYQHLTQKWGSHKKVTMSILTINVVWLLPLAYFATIKPELGLILIATAYLPLLFIAFILRAGRV